MPRSNKKKKALKPPPKHPTSQHIETEHPMTISNLMINERTTMVTRAICSGKKHGINLQPGQSNPGLGDCAFEAIVQNINARKCYKEKFNLSITSYRQIWVTDMANRTVHTDWNIYSPKEWMEGWQQMLISGTYERGIFGDLMLPGIACGVRKYILIFNTNLQSPHDPIYVVDPRRFNVQPDTAIPIILAYNQSHYKSLHLCSNADILSTINLVNEYLENRYRYSKNDLASLIEPQSRKRTEPDPLQSVNQKSTLISRTKTIHEYEKKVDLDFDFEEPKNKKEVTLKFKSSKATTKDTVNETKHDRKGEDDIDLQEIDNFLDEEIRQRFCNNQNASKLTYRLKNSTEEKFIKEVNDRRICPFCISLVKNIKLHFDRKSDCGNKIDTDHFNKMHTHFLSLKRRNQKNISDQKRKKRLKSENLAAFKWKNNEAVKKTQEKKKLEDINKYRDENNRAAARSKNKMKETTNEMERLRNFHKAIIFGPIFICSCCKRKLYENGVTKITDEFKTFVNKTKSNFYKSCIPSNEIINININGNTEKSGSYICNTCKSAMKSGKLPSMSITNGLYLSTIEDDCHLTELENNLIAQNINFQYIFCLKKSRWAATKKQMISVPVAVDKVLNTLKQLPRLPRDAGLIPIKLKRKKIYDRSHKNEFINPKKIFKVLHNLKKSGHPYYQFYDDFHTYKSRCKSQDQDGHSLIFDNISSQNKDIEETSVSEESSENESDEEIMRMKDPIKKHQFNHNHNTCLTNNYPEMLVDNDGRQIIKDKNLEFAPAEGNYPTNLLQEKDWDIKSWPALLPDGKFGLHFKRKSRLTDQQYFEQRILNKDNRFAKSPGYIFAAAAYIEQKQLSSRANISFMRGKKTVNSEGTNQYELDDAFTTFEGVRNTPKYWQKVKYEMIAKLENLGPFHMFFTLSCGDSRYDENFSTFLVENGYILEYLVKDDATIETIVKMVDGRRIVKSLNKFLEEDLNESLHEMIRNNVITATRNFQHRVDAFRTDIILGHNNPLKVKHISYRVEFQGRGAAHVHGTLWLDIKEIEKLRSFCEKMKCEKSGYLFEAFKKLRDNTKLTEEEKEAVATLTDMFITCSLNPDTVHNDKEIGKRIIEIVRAVNCHHCTGPCSQYLDKCKYGFPRYPLKKTLVVDKNELDKDIEIENSESQEQKTKVDYRKILSDVENVLKDENMIQEIMSKFDKGQTEKEYRCNMEKRINLMLKLAGEISYEDYIVAIKQTKRHGCSVLLKRDVDEIFVNNYNPEWINAWNANLDIQPVLDFFAVITYVTDYWAKSDEGITQHLKEAAAILRSEPDQKKRCQQLANTFLTHRQMSEAEAYYKILPHLKLKYSNVATIFIPTDKKELRSKFLMKLDEDDASYTKGSVVKGGKDGIFIEKADIVDKYCRREITEKNLELGKLRMIHFAKMYDPIRSKRTKEEEYNRSNENEEESQDGRPNDSDPWKDDEDRVANFYITGDKNYDYMRLPKIIKLKNGSDGEITLMEKRAFPKAARMHKKREDTNPHRFFLSELMLYTSYVDEKELGCDDEKMCRDLYLNDKDNIQYIKSYLMPFTEGVDEAIHYVQQSMTDDIQNQTNIGNLLDPEMEQEIEECGDIDENDVHQNFHLNPDEFEVNSNLAEVRKTFRKIEIKTGDEILKEARSLDDFQKKGLNIVVNYVQAILISRKGKLPYPTAPLLMVNGGAGSGKSTLISTISQYAHYTLRRDGDDPNCPIVLLGAYTGAAASNIKGQTLHTLFSFNFGAGYMSLNDKQRDEKRIMYKNLKLLIIDEISLVDADMFYKIDLRLREIMQKPVPFGNVAVIVLGDPMQMRPISGRYIFQSPRNSQFLLTYELDPLWAKFKCLTLEINHRQGNDRIYAEILNRIRVGEEIEEDIQILQDRVRSGKHLDIRSASEALYIFGTNQKVNQMNNQKLKAIGGEEINIKAICLHKSIKNFDPPVGKSGEVNKTNFQKELKIKVGAKVMLTYNVDVSDGLINGAFGELLGIIKDSKGNISKLIVKFDQDTIGQEKRQMTPDISRKYPNGTVIEKVNFAFSISKSKNSVVNTANVIQFPIRLAFACTAHKVQGSTIQKPRKVIINASDTFAAAMIYVMLSRVCSLDQIFILNEFDKSKMYPSTQALEELKRLENISINKNPTEWETASRKIIKISSLNCRSIKKHFTDIKSDKNLLQSDIILLQETWLESDEILDDLNLDGYNLHLNSRGKGKGIAIYFKNEHFKHKMDIKEDQMQLSKFLSSNLTVVVLYKSQKESQATLNQAVQYLTKYDKTVLVLGDFNFCYLDNILNSTKKYMRENYFEQLIKEPTHIEGNLLDQAYLRDTENQFKVTVETQGKYYTDHKALNIVIRYINSLKITNQNY